MILWWLLGLSWGDTHTNSVKKTLIQLRQYPEQESRSELEESLTAFMQDSLIDYYKKRKLPMSLNPSNEEFQRVISRAIRLEISNILASSTAIKTQNFIEIITGQWAESFYANVLGLKLTQEIPDTGNTGTETITVVDSKYFTGDPKNVKISDSGLEGNQNLVVDAGEFITLTLPIVNKSESYLYSTSAFLSSSSDYVSTFNMDEIELKELDPGDGTTVKIKFYLSKNAPNNTTIPINIRLFDSRHFKTTPEILTYKVKVKNLRSTQLRNVVIDTDMPGSSMDSNLDRIQPGQKFEIRNDVLVQDGHAQKALVKYQANPLLPYDYRSGVLEKKSVTGGTLFLARDDLDINMLTGSLYGTLVSASERYVWLDSNEPLLYIAVDTLIYLADENQNIQQKTSPKQSASFSKSQTPLTAQEVISLIEGHIYLEPLRVTPPNNAFDAAHGFQVKFDTESFTEQYDSQLQSTSQEDGKVSSDLSVKKVSKKISTGSYYQYRHYIEVPIEPTKKTRRRSPEAKVLAEPKVVENTESPRVRLAVGLSSMPGMVQATLYQEDIFGLAGQVSTLSMQTFTLGGGMNVGLPLFIDDESMLTFNIRPTGGIFVNGQQSRFRAYGKIDFGPDFMVDQHVGFWVNIQMSTYDDPGVSGGMQVRF